MINEGSTISEFLSDWNIVTPRHLKPNQAPRGKNRKSLQSPSFSSKSG